jgi:hypothetical protein
MPGKIQQLIDAWNAERFAPGARNILAGDAGVLDGKDEERHLKSWHELITSNDFGEEDGCDFHFGLLPMPYLGNLRRARVFLCSLNPGVGPHDYFGEHHVDEYREALLKNLRQDDDTRFPFLEPKHSWHGGSAYWAPRIRGIARAVQQQLQVKSREALDVCSRNIAVLELVPYHSGVFKLDRREIDGLESTRLMRDFVFGELLPRHRSGDCKLIVLRSREKWLRPSDDAPDFPNPTLYRNAYIAETDARSAAAIICRFT